MANIGLAFVNPAPLTHPAHVVNFAKKVRVHGLAFDVDHRPHRL